MLVEKEETGSTNDDARELALVGAPEGAVVLARRQRAGRGRAGRAFVSPDGGLYLSVVLRPRAPPQHWALLPLAAGAAVAATLRGQGCAADVKWPNDVLVGGKKLGGILVESRMGPHTFAIVGIGLNVRGVPGDVPEATCIAEHAEVRDPRALALELRDQVVARAHRLDAEGPGALLPELRAMCWTLGRKVEWENGEGIAVDIADDGALVVEAAGGRARVVAGDVRVRVR